MATHYCTAADGIKVAYDVSGSGPALILLHGGGGLYDRRMWHKTGYVERLIDHFTVITLDIRGNGDSDHPTTPDAYDIHRINADVLTVADDCGVESFSVWGFSFGGNIARCLAARSDRIEKAVIGGVAFGSSIPESMTWVADYIAKWEPIIEAMRRGELAPDDLDKKDQKVYKHSSVDVWLPIYQAMKSWPTVEAADLLCPALVYVGTKNANACNLLKADESAIRAAGVRLIVLDGLTHLQEFNQIDAVLPVVIDFLKG
ncbi:MAG: alpha/beta fold hydrolase [Anaerolineae bacterium]|nr:alpha/beta fold hydrolase [Anaerolineae bacterium]